MRFIILFSIFFLWGIMASQAGSKKWVRCKSHDDSLNFCSIGQHVKSVTLFKKFRKKQCHSDNWGVNYRKGVIWVDKGCHALFRVEYKSEQERERERERDRGGDNDSRYARPKDCRRVNKKKLNCPRPLNPRRWICKYKPRKDRYVCKKRSDNNGDHRKKRCIKDSNYESVFRKIKEFAYLKLDYTDYASRQYALGWVKGYACHESKLFIRSGTRLSDLAYFRFGRTSEQSATFALEHINRFCSSYVLESQFHKFYQFAYYDLNYTHGGAVRYALRNIVQEGAFTCDPFRKL